MPCASRLSMAFTNTGGTDSSVARIVMRNIYTVLVSCVLFAIVSTYLSLKVRFQSQQTSELALT